MGVDVADGIEGLGAIHQPGCAAAIWRRQPSSGFRAWIDALHPSQLPKARVVLEPSKIRRLATDLCTKSSMPASPERDWLIEDIDALATTFSKLVPAPYMRLRLDVITTNACRKFHIDAITARLICTYRGHGTQYGISTDGAEPCRVFSVPTTAPIILRGTLWPEKPRSGLLHRSPPIEGTGETRLVLVLDPMTTPQDDI